MGRGVKLQAREFLEGGGGVGLEVHQVLTISNFCSTIEQARWLIKAST